MKIDEDYYAGLGIPKNATNVRVRVLTADEKDKYIAQLEAENAALKRENNRKTRWLSLTSPNDERYVIWRDALLENEI